MIAEEVGAVLLEVVSYEKKPNFCYQAISLKTPGAHSFSGPWDCGYDPGTCRVGAGANGAGQHGTRVGQELRRTLARLQCAQPEPGEGGELESGTATRTGAVASAIEELSERICEYNDQIKALAEASYPHVGLLKQIKGVGTLIALTFLLTLDDPCRFRKSRDVGGYVVLGGPER